MSLPSLVLLAFLLFAAAALYASVGHAGASGYLASMALVGVAPVIMKPTALVLNILVASIAAYRFWKAGCFSKSLFWPFAVTSIPAAYIGGTIHLPDQRYKMLVGVVLLYSAVHLFVRAASLSRNTSALPRTPVALIIGGLIGILSGMTGVGGGIFLSPLMLLMGWAEPRIVSGVAAVFILVNSISGLTGHLTSGGTIPAGPVFLAPVVIAGGWIGAGYGSTRFGNVLLRRLLAVVLVIAGFKMILV